MRLSGAIARLSTRSCRGANLVTIVSASDPLTTVLRDGAPAPCLPGVSRVRAAAVRESRGTRVRESLGLLRHRLGIRATDVRARAGRGGPGARSLHSRLLSLRAG